METKKIKSFFKKFSVAIAIGAVGFFASTLWTSAFYATKMDFYSKDKIKKASSNNLDTAYSHDSYISKRYARVPALPMRTGKWGSWYPSPTQVEDKSISDEERHKRYLATYEEYYKYGLITKDSSGNYGNSFDNEALRKLINSNRLRKHPAADYQYLYENRLPDTTWAVTKNFNYDLTYVGDRTTGLYAPPGEVITIHFPGMTDEEVQKLDLWLSIGTNDQRVVPYNKVVSDMSHFNRAKNRMPIVNTGIKIDSATFKWGNPFGGIINISSEGKVGEWVGSKRNVGFSIDGAVEALHYIHGYTTESEWLRLVREAKAPVADISSDYVKFIGPKHRLSNFRKDPKKPAPKPTDKKYYPYKVMDLFDKMTFDALYAVNDNMSKIRPVSHYFTSYVDLGEAVSYVRAMFVLAPWYWFDGIIDYEGVVNEGAWGVMHENNHQHQLSWGYNKGEVSNNVLNLVSYMKFTNVYADRIKQTKDGTDWPFHNAKINGYTAQKITYDKINEYNKADKKGTYREAFDTDYSSIMTQFGADLFTEIIRSYHDKKIRDHFGLPIDIPTELDYSKIDQKKEKEKYDLTRYSQFIYRMSRMTGYDLSTYGEKTLLITNEYTTKIKDALNKIKNTNSESVTFKEFLPINSFYASQIDYDGRGYVDIARPLEIPKEYFNTGYEFKLSEYTQTFDTKIAKPNENANYYNTNSLEIITQPKYGTFEAKDDGKYLYKPNINDINREDFFEYSIKVSGSSNGSSTNAEYIVKYRVDIRLEGNSIEFVVPPHKSKDKYIPTTITKEENKVEKVVAGANVKPENDRQVIDNLINPNNKTTYNFHTDNEGYGEFEITLNKPYDTSIFQINFNNYSGTIYYADFWLTDLETGEELASISKADSWWDGRLHFKPRKLRKFKLKMRTYDKDHDKQEPLGPKSGYVQWRWFDLYKSVNSDMNYVALNSPSIRTIGDWRNGNGDGKINNASLYTITPKSTIKFNFNGSLFSLFGTKDKGYGKFDLYIDGQKVDTINTNSNSRQPNEMLYYKLLDEGNHFVKIVSKDYSPIEMNYFMVDNNAVLNDSYGNNGKDMGSSQLYDFYIIGIPNIIIILTTITLILLYLFIWSKNEKINKKKENIEKKVKSVFVLKEPKK